MIAFCGLTITAGQLREITPVLEMSPDAFSAWRKSKGLTQTIAAERLGISLRTVAAYEAGESAVPKTVVLACRGLD